MHNLDENVPFLINEGGKGYCFNALIHVDRIVERLEEQLAIPPEVVLENGSRRWMLGLSTFAALGGITYAAARFRRGQRRPVAWRTEGKDLAVFSEDGSEVWHHNFSAPMAPPETIGGPRTGLQACLFHDIDGDGRVEPLFRYATDGPELALPELFCFDAAGQIMWQFAPSRTVVDINGREWTPPYSINVFNVISGTAQPNRIVVSRNHFGSYPDQVAVLNSAGQLVSEFWHRGHLRRMEVQDVDEDGEPEILFGGVNDAPEYSCATLLAFDHRSISGASSSPSGKRYFGTLIAALKRSRCSFRRPSSAHCTSSTSLVN